MVYNVHGRHIGLFFSESLLFFGEGYDWPMQMASSYSFLMLNDLIGCCNNGLNSAGNCPMTVVFSSSPDFGVVLKHCFLMGVVSNFSFPFGEGLLFSSRSNGFLSLIVVSSSKLVWSLSSKHLIASSKISAFSIGG